jgi:hypothetical protein
MPLGDSDGDRFVIDDERVTSPVRRVRIEFGSWADTKQRAQQTERYQVHLISK